MCPMTTTDYLRNMRDAYFLVLKGQKHEAAMRARAKAAYDRAVEALQKQDARQDGKALSYAELRKMDGEPVLVVVQQPVPFESDLEMFCLIDASEEGGVVITNCIGGSSMYRSDADLAKDHISAYPVL